MYNPKPEDTSEVVLTEEILKLTEAIAKNTHENWSKGKLAEGWVYGDEFNEDKKTHPCLKEYEKLTESEKEYDRVTAMETIKLLVKMGYKITK